MINNNVQSEDQILFITTYPPRACGLATYCRDLVNTLQKQFSPRFLFRICAIEENDDQQRHYPEEVTMTFKADDLGAYWRLAQKIDDNPSIKMVMVQHEFGLFGGQYGEFLLQLLYNLRTPASVTFHTVLPEPSQERKRIVQAISHASSEIVVMTQNSSILLTNDYGLDRSKINVIPHGTHLLPWCNKKKSKKALGLENHLVLSTFGLLSSNKSIETALEALPEIIRHFPNVVYLVLGQTHPTVLANEGEAYRNFLKQKVKALHIEDHVRFVNQYLELSQLLQYLHLTDIYLFTSKDPHQAVSGTFSYAMSSACAIISTPIPHAVEMLKINAGMLIDFGNPRQLALAANQLLSDNGLREELGQNALHYTRFTVWENAAIAHAKLFEKHVGVGKPLIFNVPPVNLKHIQRLTNEIGIIQFAKVSEPDITSGFTLDDNARALIAMCLHYENTLVKNDISQIETYLYFIEYCQQPNGRFLNYVNIAGEFHAQNDIANLEDSNGRAIWSLGVLLQHRDILPASLINTAQGILDFALPTIPELESPRAIAFAIKGLFSIYESTGAPWITALIEILAEKLLKKYNAISDTNWNWFEEYLTYANSTLPEAMLCAYLVTHKQSYKMIAHTTFEFLISHLFIGKSMRVISNRGWYNKGCVPDQYGEQPIDVSYTIQALELFYKVFKDPRYLEKMSVAFSWFHGNNHLGQIIYNPLTGGCYDGLEEHGVNINQGAESTVCYLIARLTLDRIRLITTRKLGTSKPMVITTNQKFLPAGQIPKKSVRTAAYT